LNICQGNGDIWTLPEEVKMFVFLEILLNGDSESFTILRGTTDVLFQVGIVRVIHTFQEKSIAQINRLLQISAIRI
jgi:hypothetical protein